ncbi:MAG: phytanoyl-CoA dioxygenase family protein [candidate division Zixibacteria bacterium]|nr:phytanoyl-CoA dioxygenase family protein [candidate division Zixibacteria bacterium]
MTDTEYAERLWQDGYLVVRGALSADQLERIRNAYDAIGQPDRRAGDGNEVYTHASFRDPVFAELIRHPGVNGILAHTLKADYVFYRLAGHKTPGAYCQPWHWDDARWIAYGSLPPDQRPVHPPHVCAHTTFYLDTLTPETGFLKVPPGAHRRPEVLTAPAFRPDTGDAPFGPEVKLYPAAGDVVILISHLPHRGENLVNGLPRRNIVCLYCPAGTHEGGTY